MSCGEDILLAHRQTGRSTRLLEEAARLAEKQYVFVIAATVRERDRLAYEFVKMTDARRAGDNKVYLPSGGQVSFESIGSDGFRFDWQTMRPASCHPSCACLVDHHSIEDRFHRMLVELHRFDKL